MRVSGGQIGFRNPFTSNLQKDVQVASMSRPSVNVVSQAPVSMTNRRVDLEKEDKSLQKETIEDLDIKDVEVTFIPSFNLVKMHSEVQSIMKKNDRAIGIYERYLLVEEQIFINGKTEMSRRYAKEKILELTENIRVLKSLSMFDFNEK